MVRLFRRSLYSVAVLLLTAPMCSAADITIPLDDGIILIQNARLTWDGYVNVPGLSFTLRNRTSSPWDKLRIAFEVDARCNGEQEHWSRTEETFLGWMGDPSVQNVSLSEAGKEKVSLTVREFSRVMLFPQGKVAGCEPETIRATLLEAQNSKVRIGAGYRIDLEKQRADDAAARIEAEQIAAKEQAERDRVAAEEQAKKDAASAARQKRLAAERAKQQEEERVRNAKVRAEQDAKAAEEQRRVRTACGTVYQNTADKKIKDLTVREEQQVRACQALGLYPPQ